MGEGIGSAFGTRALDVRIYSAVEHSVVEDFSRGNFS